MQKALLILACVACTSTATPQAPAPVPPTAYPVVEVGTPWPKLSLTNLADHARIDTSGKVTIVHMFATWDGQGMALVVLERLEKKYAARGLAVIAFSCDDENKGIIEYVTKYGVSFPVAWDAEHRISNELHPPNEPSTWLIDRTGIVRFVEGGFHEGDEAVWDREIAKLL